MKGRHTSTNFLKSVGTNPSLDIYNNGSFLYLPFFGIKVKCNVEIAGLDTVQNFDYSMLQSDYTLFLI